MKRHLDTSPDKNTADSIGYFAIILKEKTDTKGQVYLFDENRNTYNLDRVSILSKDYSGTSGEMSLPKMFKILTDGTIIEQGAKVLISFPNGKYNPVVIGCLNPLGFQNKAASQLQVNLDRIDREVKVKNTSNFRYEKSIDEFGNVSEVIVDGTISKSVSGSRAAIHFKSSNIAIVEGQENLDLLGKTLDVGGNHQRITKEQTKNENKADNIYLYSKKVVIGHSDKRGEAIEEDPKNTIDRPVMQPLVMGTTLESLFNLLIDILADAKYTGSGIIKMIPTSVLDLKVRIKKKMPLIKSKVGFILYDPEQVEGQGGSGGND